MYLRNPLKSDDALRIAPSISSVFFILTVLALTAFDAFRESAPFSQFHAVAAKILPFSVAEVLAFLLFPAFFFAMYALCIALARLCAKGTGSFGMWLRAYAYSLVPIAIVYHVAHYFTLLLVEGQRGLSLFSDPFGKGWNLFGTRDIGVNPGIVGADVVWYIQLSLIVIGHIVALYLSHRVTEALVPEKKHSILSELPLLAVMVFYTAFGLWILSRPFAL